MVYKGQETHWFYEVRLPQLPEIATSHVVEFHDGRLFYSLIFLRSPGVFTVLNQSYILECSLTPFITLNHEHRDSP